MTKFVVIVIMSVFLAACGALRDGGGLMSGRAYEGKVTIKSYPARGEPYIANP